MFRQCRQRDDRRFAKEVFGTPGGQHPSGPRSHPVLGTSFMQGSEQGCLLPRAACRVAWGQRLCWPDFQLFDIPFLTRQCKRSNYHTVALISLSSKVMLKSLQARLQQYINRENFQMFKLVLEKAEEPEIKLPLSAGSSKKQESSRKTSISALLTMPKPFTVCGSQ